MLLGEPRKAGEHPAAHRTTPQQSDLDQNVSSAEAEKPCSVFAKGKSLQRLV